MMQGAAPAQQRGGAALLRSFIHLYARAATIVTLVLVAAAAILALRGNVQASGAAAILLIGGVLLFAAVLGAIALVRRRAAWRAAIDRVLGAGLAPILAVGIVTQVVVAFVLRPVQTSDHAAYLLLARRLASGQSYQAPDGLAYWPPGLPFFLAPFARLFASDFVVVLVANVALYAIGCIALHALTRRVFGRRAAIVAAVLFTIWPTRVLISTMASKESLTLTLVTVGLMLALQIRGRRLRPTDYLRAAGVGLTMGTAALAQPGLLLLFIGFPLVYWPRWYRLRIHAIGFFVVAGLAFASPVLPWIARNHAAFDGRFSGVATNGGSNFYRANNEMATATYSPRGTIDLSPYSELDQNAKGFELGKQWIVGHPKQMLVLSANKLVALLDSDSQGPYWAIARGTGLNDVDAQSRMSPTRATAFVAATVVSLAFWIVLCSAVAFALWRTARARGPRPVLLLPFVLSLVYCAAVFSIFESGARQHIFAVPALIAVAATVLRPSRKTGAGLNPSGTLTA